jgi:hypothetical protein
MAVSGQLLRPLCSGAHYIWGWVGSRAGLGALAEENASSFNVKLNQTVHPVSRLLQAWWLGYSSSEVTEPVSWKRELLCILAIGYVPFFWLTDSVSKLLQLLKKPSLEQIWCAVNIFRIHLGKNIVLLKTYANITLFNIIYTVNIFSTCVSTFGNI